MSVIKNTVATNRVVEVEYTPIKGFKVKLKYLSREEQIKLTQLATKKKLNKQTRQMEDELDGDKFLELWAEQAIVGWSGLKIKHLPEFYPADISSLNPEDDVPYSPETAYDLLMASVLFDNFVSGSMRDIDTFKQTAKADTIKK